jgi:hypothetical protein
MAGPEAVSVTLHSPDRKSLRCLRPASAGLFDSKVIEHSGPKNKAPLILHTVAPAVVNSCQPVITVQINSCPSQALEQA